MQKKKCGDSNEDVNIYYAQLPVAIIVWYDEVKLICNKTWRKSHLYYEKTFNMKNIVKRIAAMGAAVMMMSSMAIGASAYEAIKYGRAVGGSGSNAYISCFVTGIRTNSTVAGQAWTRTSSNNNNVYNPNCKYSGYVYASASVGGTGCGSSHSDTGKIEHSFGLKGCTSSKLVKTVHIYNDKVHGNYSTTLSVDSQ